MNDEKKDTYRKNAQRKSMKVRSGGVTIIDDKEIKVSDVNIDDNTASNDKKTENKQGK